MFHLSEVNGKEVDKVSDQLQSVGVSSAGGDAVASTATPSGKGRASSPPPCLSLFFCVSIDYSIV